MMPSAQELIYAFGFDRFGSEFNNMLLSRLMVYRSGVQTASVLDTLGLEM